MLIADFIRSYTQPVRDILSNINSQLSQAEGQRNSAEERVKRASTEITRQHTLEGERKRALNATSDKVVDAQRILEELERKRQEALDTLMQYQEEQRKLSQSLREAQQATEAALAEVKKEQKSKQEAEQLLSKYRVEREGKQQELRLKMLDSIERYLKQQTDNVLAAFATQEQRQKRIQEIEAFRKARHADPEVAKLSEQREELKKFIDTASVPGVKDMLQETLKMIESQLHQRFPGAVQLPDAIPRDNPIEEILFYCNLEGKAVFLLPFRASDWEAAKLNEPTENSSRAMCIVWNMLHELDLKAEDGEFVTERDRPVFLSRFDLEDVAILEGFRVKCQNMEIMRFILTAVPRELQEALINES